MVSTVWVLLNNPILKRAFGVWGKEVVSVEISEQFVLSAIVWFADFAGYTYILKSLSE